MTYIPYLGTCFFSRYPSVALARNIKLLGPVAARNVGDQLGHQSRSGVGVRLGAWDLRPVERLARVPLHPLQLQRTPPPSAERTPAAASLLSPTTRARVPCVCDPVLFFSTAFASSLPRREYTGHKKKVHTVAWSCTGTKVASGSVDQSVRIWTLNEGEPLSAPPSLPPPPPRHPRSSILSPPPPGHPHPYPNHYTRPFPPPLPTPYQPPSSGARATPTELKGHTESVDQLRWNPKQANLAQFPRMSHRIFPYVTPHFSHVSTGCNFSFFISQAELLGTASGDKTVRIWDARSGKCVNAIETRGVTSHTTHLNPFVRPH